MEVPLLELVVDLRARKTAILVDEGNKWWIVVRVKEPIDPDDPNSPVQPMNLTGYGIAAQWRPNEDDDWNAAGKVDIDVYDRNDLLGEFTIGQDVASETGFWRLRFTDPQNRPVDKANGRFVAE